MASFSAFLSGIALHSISFEAPTSLPFGIFSPYTYKGKATDDANAAALAANNAVSGVDAKVKAAVGKRI